MTYPATLIAGTVEARGGTVERRLLVRLNPAVEHKARGDAALATHTDLPAGAVFSLARKELDRWAAPDDDRTSLGVVVAPGSPDTVSAIVADLTRDAVHDLHDPDDAAVLAECSGFLTERQHDGRGRIGVLAAVGAWIVPDEWTYGYTPYREFHRCGMPREISVDSVFSAADTVYPDVWDTVGREGDESVYVPNAPRLIPHGIRGDDADIVREVIVATDSKSVDRSMMFHTNQGTDTHLRDGIVSDLRDGRAYRVASIVASDPETRQGGHVFFGPKVGGAVAAIAAFGPTKCLRNRARVFRVGGATITCGEIGDDTPKLKKFVARDLVWTEPMIPVCPDCGRMMKNAGRNRGYRYHDCETDAPGKVERAVDRDLEPDWHEVPPYAHRHTAKPLVRGGFDAAAHSKR